MWMNVENSYDMLKTNFYYVLTLPWIFIASLKSVLQGKLYEIWCLNDMLLIFALINYFFNFDNIMTISYFLWVNHSALNLWAK